MTTLSDGLTDEREALLMSLWSYFKGRGISQCLKEISSFNASTYNTQFHQCYSISKYFHQTRVELYN